MSSQIPAVEMQRLFARTEELMLSNGHEPSDYQAMHDLFRRTKELTIELEKPEAYAPGGAAMQLNRDLMTVQDELERTTAEWEALVESTPQ